MIHSSGPSNEAKIIAVSIIEFASRTVRDAVHKNMRSKSQLQEDIDSPSLKFDREKSAMQLKRNAVRSLQPSLRQRLRLEARQKYMLMILFFQLFGRFRGDDEAKATLQTCRAEIHK